MPYHTKQRQARRRTPVQIDLFAEDPQKTGGNMPVWSGLPTEIQTALTSLMMRLLLEHADERRIDPATEAGHDR